MSVRVVDASALGALLFGEPEGNEVSLALHDVKMVAPPLIDIEIASICLKKIRRYPEKRESLRKAFELFLLLDIEKIDVEYPAVLRLAEQTGLTAYDSCYLWVSRTMNAELVTLDKKLRNVPLA